MKLIGDLKEKVENAKTKEEARDTIKEAGMLLRLCQWIHVHIVT